MQSPKLAQVAFVVADMDAAIARWRAALGLPEPHVVTTDPGSAVRMDYRGIPSDAKAKLAFFDLGGVQLELIQPLGEDSAWAEGLRDREGFHHLAFWTEDLDGDCGQFAEQGIERAQRGDMGEGQYCYLDAGNTLGTWIELLQQKRPTE